MASSGNIYYLTNDTSWDARFKWSSSTNSSTLKTTVSYKIQVKRTLPEGDNTINTSNYDGLVLVMKESNGDYVEDETFGPKSITITANTWINIYSGSFTVSHSSSTGKAPKLLVGGTFRATNGLSWAAPSDGYISLNTIALGATISTAPNFNDEENPTITYSNKAGSNATLLQAAISLTGATDDIAYRDIDKTGSSYTFELTDEERDILRNATFDGSTKRKVRFYVKSTVNGTTYFKYLEKEFEVINCMPEIHSTIYDVNEKTVALTQNSDVFVFGASDLQFQVEATPKKGGTITGYNTICGSKSSTLQQSTFYWMEANEITFTATDNRGQTATLTLPLETIEYTRPTVNVEVGELTIDDAGGASATTTIEVSGTWFNSTFGTDGIKNELTFEIKHTGTNDEWVPQLNTYETVDDNPNTYRKRIEISGLDYTQQLTFQARVSDKATIVESVEKTVRLVPIFDWGENDFNFNVPVSFQGEQMADFIIETGTAEMGTNGTWHWSKWKSGKAECYGVRNYGNMAITSTFGELYVSDDFTQSLPSGLFGEAPYYVSIEPMSGGYGTWVSKGYGDAATTSDTMTFCLVRAKSNTLTAVNIAFHVIGSWKEPEATTTE